MRTFILLPLLMLLFSNQPANRNCGKKLTKNNFLPQYSQYLPTSAQGLVGKPDSIRFNMEPRFTVLTLGVDNLERSLTFYRDGLGFPTPGIIGKEFEHGPVVFFDLKNGMKLALYPRKDLAWDAKIPQSPASPTEFSIGYNVRKKEEVDEFMITAQKAGAKIVKPAQPAFWGGYTGYFQDPDGHLWEIVWNPNFIPE